MHFESLEARLRSPGPGNQEEHLALRAFPDPARLQIASRCTFVSACSQYFTNLSPAAGFILRFALDSVTCPQR